MKTDFEELSEPVVYDDENNDFESQEVESNYNEEGETETRNALIRTEGISPMDARVMRFTINRASVVNSEKIPIEMMNEQMHSATLTEQKMASIITWLFEVIGSGDGQEHKAEIQEMRDTVIRAHYGINMSNSPQGAGSLRVAKDSGVAAEFRLADMDEQSIEGSGYAQGQSSERAEDSGAPTWTEAFASIDTNKDGNISPSEFARWPLPSDSVAF